MLFRPIRGALMIRGRRRPSEGASDGNPRHEHGPFTIAQRISSDVRSNITSTNEHAAGGSRNYAHRKLLRSRENTTREMAC
jgi:hypothetical protein